MSSLLKHLLFPNLCLSCCTFISLEEGTVCFSCRETVTLSRNLLCGQCRARLPESKKICHPESYLLGIATSYHKPAIENSLRSLKFKHIEEASLFLSELLIKFFDDLEDKPHFLNDRTRVIHIPLSQARLRERGFDQSSLIAKNFAQKFNLIHEKNILTRPLDRPPQSLLSDKKERRKNISGAFMAKINNTDKKIPIILIDDITTTGSTFDEAVKVLRQSHYEPILALAVAG